MCIVDAIDTGTVVWRTAEQNWLLPSSRLFPWAKRAFVRQYLRR